MSTLTIARIAADLGADPGHWDTGLEIPVLSGLPQAQGDLLILPADGYAPPAAP